MRTALPLYVLWLASTTAWWLLALAPVAAAPEWVLRTRTACFGAWPGGVPDAAGWVSLLTPVPMLTALLVLQGDELRVSLAQMRRASAALLLALPIMALLGVGLRLEQAYAAKAMRGVVSDVDVPLPADLVPGSEQMPDLELIDQHGRAISSRALRGRQVILTFAYAHCASVCPAVLDAIRQAKGDAQRVVITLDPRRDTPSTLPRLANDWRLGDDTLLLSGSVADVEEAARAFRVSTDRNPQTGEIAHPGLVFVIDGRGRIRYTLNGPSASWLTEALARSAAQ